MDQVEDNKDMFTLTSQPVEENRLCWPRQALFNLSGHSQVLEQVTPMMEMEEGCTSDALRAQQMQQEKP